MSGRFNIKKPDTILRDKKLDTLNSQLKKVDQEIALVRKQIEKLQVSENTQSSKQKLHEQLKEIIKTQSDLKGRRQQIHDRIKQVDAQIKRKNSEIAEKVGRKTQYQSVPEIQQRLGQIDEDISSGHLSLVEEKLCVKEMQLLNKLVKDMQQLEPVKKTIEEDKLTIAELKQELNTLNPKEVSVQFENTQAKLNNLQTKNQVVYDQRSKLFAKKAALYNKRDEIYSQIKKIRADFDTEFKTYKKNLDDERLKREEEQKLSSLFQEKEEKLVKLQEKLIHAKKPAFQNEINAIEIALFALDPTFVKPDANIIDFPGTQFTKPVKKVEADDLIPIMKEKEEFFPPSAKSKKNKKKGSNSSGFSSGKFSLEPTLISILAEMDVSVPMSRDNVPATVEQLKKKYEDFLSRQEEETEKNTSKATLQLEKLEMEYTAKEEQIRKEFEEKSVKEAT